ncbi:family 10 glycosylhydrolase [Verrucomicrobiaceae bacterium N1E253]|uniref:Family 10 glycosylhydrolase n=2 Tax=Oceaniferula marina TaxID=2748318 RepID=A0A851GDN8_9BACT|nr:family 10 glycosylhydrolase [Oceaniferula marina]
MAPSALAQNYRPSSEQPPMVTREFRAAWVATVFNIDWPSKKGLSASSQQAELRSLLDQAAKLKLNAILFQVRPNGDALYQSSIEPWSHWLSGTMGKSPGYDPLAYCISQAHARGIEVHAWFNPFRAMPSEGISPARNHITRTHPSIVKKFKTYKWMDPANSFTRNRALSVISDVTRRYDVDGIHIDDYFYPYPDLDNNNNPKRQFPDGKSPSQRRGYVDGFVHGMYRSVKKQKPWVRVGISPFGIWKPGVPAGTTASINAYEHLAADSRKWLQQGWCDYMSPQLYWRIHGPQSYTKLLNWWRAQSRRPVWPGIATARINSSEDPGRPASEIVNQVNLSRTLGRNYVGHVHWSMKSLRQNRGGITKALGQGAYRYPALVPPMPWLSTKQPATPNAKAKGNGRSVTVHWSTVRGASKYAIQARYGKAWFTVQVVPAGKLSTTLQGSPDAIAISAVDRYGTTSRQRVLAK